VELEPELCYEKKMLEAGTMFMKRKSSGAGEISLCSPVCYTTKVEYAVTEYPHPNIKMAGINATKPQTSECACFFGWHN